VTPPFGRPNRWLAVALVSTILIVGCGGGSAADDVAKPVAKALGSGADEGIRGGGFGDDAERAFPRLNQGLQQPARRVAGATGTPTSLGVQRVAEATHIAFCEGWAIYRQYGGFPSGSEWYGIVANRIQAVAFAPPAAVSQVVSVFETVVDAYETGDVASAQLDLYCQFG
jgi:hypothetical protein